MTNVAYILSLIAPLFSYLKEEDYVSMQQNLAWLDVRAAAGAPLQEALSLPTWPARSSFQNELLVPGMPLAAMPVESLYKAWSTQQGNAFGATRGLYLGDPARHLSQVYRELAIEVPAEFASMPDHLTLELELLADEISWRYDCAVYIVTIYDYEDYDSDIHYAAVNIYDSNSFGIGENREGIMLMLSTYDRDYDLYVRDGGTAEYAVNKYGRHQMTEEFLDNFADDDWAGGFRDYLNACAEYLSLAEQGHPVRKPLIKVLPMALGIGIILALAVCLFLKAKMKSVRQGAEADTYVTAEGLNLTEQYDNYTHTTETRRKISRDSDGGSSDHSGGGGSSTSGKY